MELKTICNNLQLRRLTTFRIRNGKGFFIVKGKEIPTLDFYKLYPVPLVFFRKENVDKRESFLNELI